MDLGERRREGDLGGVKEGESVDVFYERRID